MTGFFVGFDCDLLHRHLHTNRPPCPCRAPGGPCRHAGVFRNAHGLTAEPPVVGALVDGTRQGQPRHHSGAAFDVNHERSSDRWDISFLKGLDAFVLFVLLLAPPAYCATLRQAFNENQGEFLRLLNDQSTAMPGVQRLQVTQEEKEAIDRVRTMFFE